MLKLTLSVFVNVVCILGVAQAQQPALRFLPLAPCRIVDTRNANGAFGGPLISAQTSRSFPILTSPCLSGVPSGVAAYSLNVTAVPGTSSLGFLTIWPSGQAQPFVSTLNSIDGRVKANAAIVPAGSPNGAVSVFATDPTHVVLDINGIFVPASNTNPTPFAFFALPPCRVVDTRNTSGPLGGPSLVGGQARSFPVQSSTCGIPTNGSAKAYSFNFTVVPSSTLGFLTIWPTGGAQPFVSTLNAPTGTVTANAAIVPATGANGAISAFVTDNTDLIIDVNGYFAPSTSSSDLSMYSLPPCRVLDTRLSSPGFVGTLNEDTTASPCAVIPNAQAVVLNATVIPPQHLGFLSLWPDGETQPLVSTLNALDGQVTANMAIVPTTSGVIDAFATDPTQLVLDTSAYFASGTAPAPQTFVLTVAKSGAGAGTVTSLDNKVNCGAVCAVSYVSGTGVTLTVSPAAGNTFLGWSGGGCAGTGNCFVNLSAATTVTASFNGPSISLNPGSVGANLETLATGSLSLAAPAGGLPVTLTSSDPTKVLLLNANSNPGGTTVGTASFTATIPAGKGLPGDLGFPGFWVQALASSCSGPCPTITASASGYTQAVATVTLTPSGFQLIGPLGAGGNFTSTLGTTTPLTVGAAQLDTSGNVLSTSQVLRGGLAPVNVTVNSDRGDIVGNPAVVQPGTTTSNTVSFQPTATGTSHLNIAQPGGFSAPATGTQLTATVTPPSISINPANVGFNLQTIGVGQLSPAPPNAVSVTISSSDASKVLLSTSPTTAGASSITLQVAAGATSLVFYIQGLASSCGAACPTITASTSGYSSGTAQVVLTGSAFLLSGTGPNGMGVNFGTTIISPPTGLTVAIWQLDTSSRPLTLGNLRPGISAQSVAVGSSNTNTGTIVGSPAVFNSGDSSNSTLSFQPKSCTTPCSSVLSVTQPSGFSAPASGGQLTVTVNKPTVTIRMIVTTIGNNLQVPASGALDAPATSNLTVTITTPTTSKVLLSTSATAAGSHSITVTVPAGGGVNSFGFPTYYVQAQDKTGTVTLTATAPGFNSGTINVTLAPAGFVIDGGNGVGRDVGAFTGSNVPLTVSAYVLNPTGTPPLAPTQLAEALRGGLSASVTVTSNSGAGVVSGSPVVISGGNASGTVTVHAASPGTATITAAKPSTPTGFDTPSSGNHLGVIIQ